MASVDGLREWLTGASGWTERTGRVTFRILVRATRYSWLKRQERDSVDVGPAHDRDPALRVAFMDREKWMTVTDIGPEPQIFDLENATLENTKYRAVAWSGKYLQLTLMSIPAVEDIGLEAHPETDQFLRLDAGRGRVQMGPTQDRLDFDREV